MKTVPAFLASAALLAVVAGPAAADISDAAGACIDELRARMGNVGGEILGEEFSEAATMVRLRDGNGAVYECLVWSGPEIAEFRQVGGEGASADDGGSAMAGAAPREPVQGTLRVQFAPGSSGASYTGSLGSGDALTYVLNARDGQFLTVDFQARTEYLDFIIYVPSGDILDQGSQGGFQYYGQLYQSGDHRVEVFYNGNQGTDGDYEITFRIE